MDPKTGRMNQSAIIHNYGDAATAYIKFAGSLARSGRQQQRRYHAAGGNAQRQPDAGAFHHATRSDVHRIYGAKRAYYVGFAADVDGQVAEPDESNNYSFTNTPVIFVQSENIIGKGTGGDDVISLVQDSLVVSEPKMYLTINGMTTTYNPYRVGSINIDGAEGMTESP